MSDATPERAKNDPKMTFRSLLFVPGDSARKIERALASLAEIIILDLEDAVAPVAKPDARALVKQALANPRNRLIAVRINAQDSEWYRDDLSAVGPSRPDYFMLPKCRSTKDLTRIDHELSLLEHLHGFTKNPISLLPLVSETADSLAGLDYRSAPARTAALCFAAEDLASDLGIFSRDERGVFAPPIAHARNMTLIGARAAGLPAIDTPFPHPGRGDLLLTETQLAVRSGFAGKLCIHPDQIAIVQEAFMPSPERLDWANRVITAFAGDAGRAANSGVTVIDGRMVDKAHLRLAEELVQMLPKGSTP